MNKFRYLKQKYKSSSKFRIYYLDLHVVRKSVSYQIKFCFILKGKDGHRINQYNLVPYMILYDLRNKILTIGKVPSRGKILFA